MQIREVSYSETVSYRQYCNERFGVVAVVEESENPDGALDRARAMVKAALSRSERERSFAEKVASVEREISYMERGGHADERVAYEQMLDDLKRTGPQGDFESIVLSNYVLLDDEDDDDEDEDEPCPL